MVGLPGDSEARALTTARKIADLDPDFVRIYPTVVVENSRLAQWFNGVDVVISNPVKTKAIASAKIKNDKLDSQMLAQLLRADLLATVYASSKQNRQLKEFLRHRSRLVRDTVRMKNRIHNILAKNNLTVPVSDLFGHKGVHFLSQAVLPAYHRRQVQTYLALYQSA